MILRVDRRQTLSALLRFGVRILCLGTTVETRNALRHRAYRRRPYLPIECLVEAGDSVVQVGTPHPRTLERLARAAGRRGQVFVVEAELSNFQALSTRAEVLNEAGFSIKVGHFAAGAEFGTLTMRISDFQPDDHTLAGPEIRMDNDERGDEITWTEQSVEVQPLDASLAKESVAVLIVTANGYEPIVLEGASETLHSMKPGARLFSKAHARLTTGGTIADGIEAQLTDAGFTCSRTKKSRTVSNAEDWTERQGDVFGSKRA